MKMDVSIKTFGSKKSNVAFVYSTKDRPEFTRETLPRILDEEGDFDLYWTDGSTTPEGADLFNEFKDCNFEGTSHLREVHLGVTGGAAIAIQYAWQLLFNKGYDYIGLIENDVLLEKGWFKKIFNLFETQKPYNDLKVGAVSARCFQDRILLKKEGYAVMSNLGAGMFLTCRELIIPLLENWRRPLLKEARAMFKAFTGKDYPIPRPVILQDPEVKQEWVMTHDWWWECVLLMHGYCALACVPSMARNIDPIGKQDVVET